mmetsp:Transcript_85642/g.154169  ORF Transcript_85642/g.154169 Transcript_85642/m.154169 type:complete len:210 (-) Transcript_85642:1599-2228(-)
MPWSMPWAQSAICACGTMRIGPRLTPSCACMASAQRSGSLRLLPSMPPLAVTAKGSPIRRGRSRARRTGLRWQESTSSLIDMACLCGTTPLRPDRDCNKRRLRLIRETWDSRAALSGWLATPSASPAKSTSMAASMAGPESSDSSSSESAVVSVGGPSGIRFPLINGACKQTTSATKRPRSWSNDSSLTTQPFRSVHWRSPHRSARPPA